MRGEHVTEAAQAGDPERSRVMAELGWWIALGLANLTALLDPSVIVIGGGMVAAGELLLGPDATAPTQRVVYAGTDGPEVSIVGAALGELAGAVGAGAHRPWREPRSPRRDRTLR